MILNFYLSCEEFTSFSVSQKEKKTKFFFIHFFGVCIERRCEQTKPHVCTFHSTLRLPMYMYEYMIEKIH